MLVFALVLASCSDRPEGYAVVLWPDEGLPLTPAQVAPITAHSDIQKSLTLGSENGITVDEFRVLRFDTREAAESYRESFLPFSDLYAISMRTALPVRELPDRLSPRVYRLRDGEIMKILRRQEEPSDEAGFVDYWYEVLTREGIRGWVFGYYLELSDSGGLSLQPVEENTRTDRLLVDIRSRVWRPSYFREMIGTRRIDLDTFSPEYGFFPVADGSSFELVLPTHSKTFEYTEYFSPRIDTIEFENSSLIIRVETENDITIQYTLNGQEETVQLTDIAEDIADVVQSERDRRKDLLNEFLSRGNILASTAYGTISLEDSGRFFWDGFDRLVPRVIPADFSGSGALEFSVFMNDELRSRYDGVFTLTFDGDRGAVFLYSITDEGMRTVFVPANLVSSNTVVSEALTPIVIFFRFVRS